MTWAEDPDGAISTEAVNFGIPGRGRFSLHLS
jgi:hypothetical protein